MSWVVFVGFFFSLKHSWSRIYTASDRLEKLVCECVWDSSSTDCDGYSFRRVDVCSLGRSCTQVWLGNAGLDIKNIAS